MLEAPGDFVTHDLSGAPLLVVRGDDGQVSAFLNVCRHRGPRVEQLPCGSGKKAFVCPYHSWSYMRDGQPPRDPAPGGLRRHRQDRARPRARASGRGGGARVRPCVTRGVGGRRPARRARLPGSARRRPRGLRLAEGARLRRAQLHEGDELEARLRHLSRSEASASSRVSPTPRWQRRCESTRTCSSTSCRTHWCWFSPITRRSSTPSPTGRPARASLRTPPSPTGRSPRRRAPTLRRVRARARAFPRRGRPPPRVTRVTRVTRVRTCGLSGSKGPGVLRNRS